MAITKLGARILGGMEKDASFGKIIGKGWDAFQRFAMPGFMAFSAVNDIASGQQSVGGALGELAAGWRAGRSAIKVLMRWLKI